MDLDLINVKLLSNWLNWLYVWIVLILTSMAVHAVVCGLEAQQKASTSISPD